MKKTDYTIRFITLYTSGYRRVYEDENGDKFVTINNQWVSIMNPMFAWSSYEYNPIQKLATKTEDQE